MSSAIYVPAGEGESYWGAGDRYTFLVTGEESGGSYFTMHAAIPPGGGPPPHWHLREEEQFYVLAGEVELLAGDRTIRATAGDFVHVPRGTIHAFFNNSDAPAEMLLTYSPAGIENLFRQAFAPVTDPAAGPPPITAESVARFNALEAEFGQESLPADMPQISAVAEEWAQRWAGRLGG